MACNRLLLLVAACSVMGAVADDDGDDFSNNLFTDLTPFVNPPPDPPCP